MPSTVMHPSCCSCKVMLGAREHNSMTANRNRRALHFCLTFCNVVSLIIVVALEVGIARAFALWAIGLIDTIAKYSSKWKLIQRILAGCYSISLLIFGKPVL